MLPLAGTREKVKFSGPKELLDEIDAALLPVCYGGAMEERFLTDTEGKTHAKRPTALWLKTAYDGVMDMPCDFLKSIAHLSDTITTNS